MILSVQYTETVFTHRGFDYYMVGDDAVLDAGFEPSVFTDDSETAELYGGESVTGETLWGEFVYYCILSDARLAK